MGVVICAVSVWLLVFVVGIVSWPVASFVFGLFVDRGYFLSKAVGLIFLTFVVFVLSTLRIIPLCYNCLVVLLLLWAAVNVYLYLKHGLSGKVNFKTILLSELIFTSFYIFWLFIKSREPSIYEIERFMDFGFIQTLLNSSYLPLEDVWMSGVPLNYYYFGHTASFFIIKLSVVPTEVGFHLVSAFLFATLGTSIFRLAGEVLLYLNIKCRRLWLVIAGIVSVFFVLFAGNIGTGLDFLKGQDTWYPAPTRMIPGTITEMPLYSFILADLHAHVWGFLNGIIVLTVLFLVWKKENVRVQDAAILGFFIGIAVMTNTWDGASLGFLTGVVLFLTLIRQEKSLKVAIRRLRTYLLIIVLLTLLVSLPWLLFYEAPTTGVSLVKEHSPLKLWLLFWGQFVLISLLYLLLVAGKLKAEFKYHGFIVSVMWAAFFMLALVEAFYVGDILKEGEWFRANTVFKVTSQIWLWLGSMCGPVVVWMMLSTKKAVPKIFIVILVLIVTAGSAVYTVKALKQVYFPGSSFQGLDQGLSWWKNKYPDDYNAYLYLKGLRDNYPEGERKKVILEAEGESYTNTSRYCTFLGWPTVAGWSVHEWTWRGGFEPIGARGGEVREVYMGESTENARLILKKYKVDYIVVGQVERERYSDWLKIDRFHEIADLIFLSGDTAVYKYTYQE